MEKTLETSKTPSRHTSYSRLFSIVDYFSAWPRMPPQADRSSIDSIGSLPAWMLNPLINMISMLPGGGEQLRALGLLIARRNRSPFLHAGPEALDEVAVLVDPGRTSHRCLVALGRDGRARAEAADQHAEGLRGIAAISHDPQRHSGEKAQPNRRHRQFLGLSGGQRKADRPARAVDDDGGLGGEPAAPAPHAYPAARKFLPSLSLQRLAEGPGSWCRRGTPCPA